MVGAHTSRAGWRADLDRSGHDRSARRVRLLSGAGGLPRPLRALEDGG